MKKKNRPFGVVYQDIMRSTSYNLTPEAKCIYAYLASMAGNDGTCYPSKELMQKETGMAKNRFDKHMQLLIKSGLIERKRMISGNLKNKNIYKVTNKLNNCYRAVENEPVENRAVENRAVENEPVENRAVENRAVENRATNNNSLNNNSLNNNRKKKNNPPFPENPEKVKSDSMEELGDDGWEEPEESLRKWEEWKAQQEKEQEDEGMDPDVAYRIWKEQEKAKTEQPEDDDDGWLDPEVLYQRYLEQEKQKQEEGEK